MLSFFSDLPATALTVIRVSFDKHAVIIQIVAQKCMTKPLTVTFGILKRILTDMERAVTVSLTNQQNLDNWLTVHRSITLVDFQLGA